MATREDPFDPVGDFVPEGGLPWSITEFEEEEYDEGVDKDEEQQANDIEDEVFPGDGKTKGLQDFISCHGKSNTRLLIFRNAAITGRQLKTVFLMEFVDQKGLKGVTDIGELRQDVDHFDQSLQKTLSTEEESAEQVGHQNEETGDQIGHAR